MKYSSGLFVLKFLCLIQAIAKRIHLLQHTEFVTRAVSAVSSI